jgi:Domain of unknown function (DUF4440)
MRFRIALCYGVAVSVMSVSSLGAQRAAPTERDSAAIVVIERKWLDARDSAALDAILATDFIHPVATGDILDKGEHIAWITQHPLAANLHARFASLIVRVYGDAAVATGSVVTVDGRGQQKGKNVFTDVFIRRRGRWQAVNAQETAVSGVTR